MKAGKLYHALLSCHGLQAAWILEDTDDEDSDNSDEESDGMVLDVQKDQTTQDGSDNSDVDECQLISENFDDRTETDTEMAVSFHVIAVLGKLIQYDNYHISRHFRLHHILCIPVHILVFGSIYGFPS